MKPADVENNQVEAGEASESDLEIVEAKTTVRKSKKRKSEGPLVRATPAKKKRIEVLVRKTDGTRRTQRDLTKLTVAKLKEELRGYGIDMHGMRLKKHYVARLLELINEEWSRLQRLGQTPRNHPVPRTVVDVERSAMKRSRQPQFAAPAPTPRIARRTRSKMRKK